MAKHTPTEAQSRTALLRAARQNGCEADYLRMMSDCEQMISQARTEEEYKMLALVALKTVSEFFASRGSGGFGTDWFVVEPAVAGKV